MPDATERPAFVDAQGQERAPDPEGPVAGFVFKTLADPFSGQLSLVRILSGTISGDVTLKNMRSGENERLGSLLFLTGKTQTPCKEPVGPGAIVAVAKLKNTRTGDSLCDEKQPFALPMPKLPPQLITYALAPKEKGDEDKVYSAIQRLLDEDITLRLARDEENGDILLSGMGQLHIELSVEKAKRRFKVDINLKTPKVPYRETVRGKVQVQGRHKKQSGGHGQFGDVWIQFEPVEGEGIEFAENVFGGSVPKNFFPAVEKGVRQAAEHGVLAGYPMVGMKATLLDGSYHPVDSSEMAFIMAAKLAYKAAIPEAGPVLLEPIGALKAHVPADNTGDIMGEVTKRRGRVLGMNPDDDGLQVVEAEVPVAEMQDFTTFLRQLTQGRGYFTFEFVRYETLPQMLENKVIEQAKALGNFADED